MADWLRLPAIDRRHRRPVMESPRKYAVSPEVLRVRKQLGLDTVRSNQDYQDICDRMAARALSRPRGNRIGSSAWISPMAVRIIPDTEARHRARPHRRAHLQPRRNEPGIP